MSDNKQNIEKTAKQSGQVDVLVRWETEFRKRLRDLLNEFHVECGSDTPDYILAEYLSDCLKTFDKAVKQRSEWYSF